MFFIRRQGRSYRGAAFFYFEAVDSSSRFPSGSSLQKNKQQKNPNMFGFLLALLAFWFQCSGRRRHFKEVEDGFSTQVS